MHSFNNAQCFGIRKESLRSQFHFHTLCNFHRLFLLLCMLFLFSSFSVSSSFSPPSSSSPSPPPSRLFFFTSSYFSSFILYSFHFINRLFIKLLLFLFPLTPCINALDMIWIRNGKNIVYILYMLWPTFKLSSGVKKQMYENVICLAPLACILKVEISELTCSSLWATKSMSLRCLNRIIYVSVILMCK